MTFEGIVAAIAGSMLVATALRYGAYWIRMWRQPKVLTAERDEVRSSARRAAPEAIDGLELHYVIPAFHEVETLPGAFASLRRAISLSPYRATVTIVTSVHERPGAGGRTTADVASTMIAGLPWASVVVDQSDVPSMAASFNTGMRSVASRTRAHERGYVIAYNADSTATADSVRALGDTLIARSLPRVAQINFFSLHNLSEMTGPGGWYTRGAAYYQTRWALGFEVDLHRRNSRQRRRGPLGHSYHLKGHGLALRVDTALDAGGFSTQTPCEDLELGFRLSLADVPVHAVPLLEDTEHPARVAAVIAQKRYWYSGMVDVFHFHRLLADQRARQPLRFELQRLASLYRSAACFLLAPLPSWILVASAFILGQPLLALPPVVNAIVSAWLIRRTMRSSDPAVGRLPLVEFVLLPAGILAWSMTRNIGPIAYLWSMLTTTDRVRRQREAHLGHLD